MTPPRLLEDTPEQLQPNLWPGLNRFAKTLATLLPTLPHSAPVLLHGDWGAGKTTVLHALQERIPHPDGSPRRTIWFDAWRYDGAEVLLPALVRRVWSAADEAKQKSWRTDGTLKALWHAAVAVGLRMAPTVIEAAGQKNLAKLVSAIGSVASGGGGDASDGPPDDPTRVLYEKFAEVIHQGWDGERPLIIVDDLDRCRPDSAVALLDGIRTLVANAPELRCNFVVALDRGVLVEAISQKFTGISGYDGHRYLEKVFPLTFAVPQPEGVHVNWLIDHYCDALGGPLDAADLRDAVKETFALPVFANPRLLKRALNRLALVRHFEGAPATVAQDRALVDWLAATDRWPVLRRMLQRYRDDQWKPVQHAVSNSGAADEHLAQQLLAQYGARDWLGQRFFQANVSRLGTMRDAEARLQACAL